MDANKRRFTYKPRYIIKGLYTSALAYMAIREIPRDRVIIVNSPGAFYKLKAIEGDFVVVEVSGWPECLIPEEHVEFNAIMNARKGRISVIPDPFAT